MRRFNAWWLAPLAVAASVVAMAAQRARVPVRDEWAAATAHVRTHLEPGDGVTWRPWWAGEGRLFLAGLPAFQSPDERPDFARYERVWLLGAFGEDAGDLPSGTGEVAASQAFGDLTVELVRPAGPRVVGDLYADLETAQVVRVGRDGEQRCDFWDGRGWHCDLQKTPDETRRCLGLPVGERLRMHRKGRGNDRGLSHCGLEPWLHVSRDVRVVGGGPRRCVWMHPVAGAAVEIRWPGAPAAGTLVVDHGFTDSVLVDHDRPATRTKAARLVVRQGDAVVLEHTVEPIAGWHRVEAPLSGHGPLVFALTAAATVDAHFCFDPTVRGPR